MKTEQPYELLVRWKDGVFSGASYKTLTTISDDYTGEVYAVKESDPQALDQSGLSALMERAKADAQVAATAVELAKG